MSKENEALTKQLEGFRNIHRLFMDIMSTTSQGDKEELICRQFNQLSGAKETALFTINQKTDRFEFKATAGQQTGLYEKGFLEIDDEEWDKLEKLELRADHSNKIRITTKDNVYHFDDKFIMCVPVGHSPATHGVLMCEYANSFAIEDSDQAELVHVFVSVPKYRWPSHSRTL